MPKSISQRISVSSAKLELKLAGKLDFEGNLPWKPENRLILYPVTQKWKESEVTYSSAMKDQGWEGYEFVGIWGDDFVSTPIDTNFRIISSENGELDTWVEFNVTDIVNEMIKNPGKYDGFLIAEGLVKNGGSYQDEEDAVNDTANSYNTPRYFYGAEYKNVEDRPKLTINADVGVLNQKAVTASQFTAIVNNNTVQLTNETSGDLSFGLYDMRGRLVYRTELVKAGKAMSFALPQTAKGIYSLQAVGRESTFSKMIKL